MNGKLLRVVRTVLAGVMLVGITALLHDATGVLQRYVGWMAKVQLLPAALALNVGVVVAVVAVTWLVGRLYCSVVCPLGVLQDVFTWVHGLVFRKRKFVYRRPSNVLRYVVLGLFVALMLLGLNGMAILVAPYSMFGRIATQIHSTGVPQVVAIVSVVVIGISSFCWGRLWCNTLCPVGSVLSLVSRYSLFGIRVDEDKCVGCRKCEKSCKAMCINIDEKCVDGSRCVDCMNCLGECKFGAIGFSRRKRSVVKPKVDESRRKFVAATAVIGGSMVAQAQEQKLDGGLAALMDKQVPGRKRPLKPFGARSLRNFSSRCTGCQLCVSKCPEHVLRPSTKLESLMQPELDYTNGYCRMACTRCSQVCPAGAIQPIDREEKTAISIGVAVTLHQNCISAEGKNCGACARHCPAGAIRMVTDASTGNRVPSVDESRCLGCGACEYYCPARPMAAIYVEGREHHTEV